MTVSKAKINDIEAYLESIPKFSKTGASAANFDLSRMLRFCEQIGNPQNNFKSIHIAGTNGKGTVCRMLASIYQQAGYKTGLYTSPHLIHLSERFRVNAVPISGKYLADFFDEFGDHIADSGYTYFEITTAIAFWFFAKENIDIAVLETGLGGRLDATNVVDSDVSVITSIGLDHTDILGDTIEKIAAEKAGIIKKGKPVVIGTLAPSAKDVINSVAKSLESEVMEAEDLSCVFNNAKIVLSLNSGSIIIDGKNRKIIDAENVAIVYKIVDTLISNFPVNTNEFAEGIENVNQRFQNHAVFEKLSTDHNWFFDGAHNPQSVRALVNHLLQMAPATEWTVVLSFMKDKLNREIADLWNKFPRVYVYEMEGDRAASIELMKKYLPDAKGIANEDLLRSDQLKSELVIFSGSFYFYTIVSNWMGAIASADQINPSAL